MQIRRYWRVGVAILLSLWAKAAMSGNDCMLLLMHGKWGAPQNMAVFGSKMSPVCDYESLEMPWSRRRNYDSTYDDAMTAVSHRVAAAREKGYQRVVLGGHSFGANAALAYMNRHGDVDAVLALAPGHSPDFMYKKGIGREAVDRARQLVAAGQGSETLAMEDLNQSRQQSIRMRADILLSYFDPTGLGNMALTAPGFKKAVPLLWVIGDADPLYRLGSGYAFDRTPPHPASRYLAVQADHASTPDAAVREVIDWLKELP